MACAVLHSGHGCKECPRRRISSRAAWGLRVLAWGALGRHVSGDGKGCRVVRSDKVGPARGSREAAARLGAKQSGRRE